MATLVTLGRYGELDQPRTRMSAFDDCASVQGFMSRMTKNLKLCVALKHCSEYSALKVVFFLPACCLLTDCLKLG